MSETTGKPKPLTAEQKRKAAEVEAAKRAETDAMITSSGFSDKTADLVPGLRELFDKATTEHWSGQVGQQKFINAVQALPWVQANGAYMLQYAKAKAAGGEGWDDQVRTARQNVKDAAVKVGADLDETALSAMADSYLMFGWGEQGRTDNLAKALTGQLSWTDGGGKTHTFGQNFLNYGKGAAATTIAKLKQVAVANGVELSEGWFTSAARAIEGGLGTDEDYLGEIKQAAKSKFPVYAKQIDSGFNVNDLVSPYVNTMANVLELDPQQITADDPMIQRAIGQVDPKTGEPKVTGIWDFQQQLRKDPRWQRTDNAYKSYNDAAQSVLQMFGFR